MLNRITLAQRLWLWAMLASFLFFCAVGLGWHGLYQARDSLRVVHDQRLMALEEFAEIGRRLDENRRLVLLAFQYDPSGQLVRAHERPVGVHLDAIEANNEAIAALWAQAVTWSGEQAHADAFEAAYAEWLLELDSVLASLRLEDFRSDGMVAFLGIGMPLGEQAMRALDGLREAQRVLTEQDYRAAERRYQWVLMAYLALAVLGVLAGGLTAFSVLRRLRRAFAVASESLGAMAAGDLSRPVPQLGEDEVGRMLRDMAVMRDSLRGLIAAVRQQMQRLEREARNMADVAAGSSVATQQQAVAVDAMSRLVKGLSHTIERVETHAQATRRTTEESASHSAESERAVRAMADEMQGISEVVADTARHIRELDVLSGDISSVLGVIREVAEQTNLLALNAAIEAARAGEQGRGFSVVADEVRLLARRTGNSVAQVSDIVARIQNGTQDVVRSMGRAEQRVRDGVGLADNAGAAIAQIRHGTERVIEAVSGIGDAVQVQARAMREITEQVEGVAGGTRELSHSAERGAEAAADLDRLAAELARLSARFIVEGASHEVASSPL
ncbi:Chemotaxis regulator BdlA [Streptococcus pneumoniae]|uniref:methyl-accepting chemotaxis protein n=1 Tax=Stutzerimonas stutzeri TaxID=316 RepID=UPI0005E4E99B|nr:methyl-accepting chemotaxis protein [Stutzerimonas stutzeri]CJL65325.1 Chemotaxis regulator BdlA [Streptococcus pneumoniae]HAJ85909.1 methyl-accepting chemotaxis protein [Pseudomonas sp.]MCQ4227544.1 methyl-accepting chemotaxis protein [Stutzerimonas stutzeri]MDH0444520.1 methyl-accepting chemotaxis protein [Stutzerimonas stutzeri]RRV82519.1 methyl-accepting chemotaxis protein [Stutzerimonas stutzeri]